MRTGRFKKKMVTEEKLKSESEILAPIFKKLKKMTLSPAEYATCYLLIYLQHRYPKTWPGSKRAQALDLPSLLGSVNVFDQLGVVLHPAALEKIRECQSLGDILRQFSLQSTPLSVARALLSWDTGIYSLVLMDRIPSPREVLEQQIDGKRCVTVLSEEKSLARYILGERDAMSFTMHDLIHADHFFKSTHLMQGQIGFYRQMYTLLETGSLQEFFQKQGFEESFEYLISDMNAYCVHLWKGFKAIIKHAPQPTQENLWRLLKAEGTELDALLALNTPAFQNPDQTLVLENWCKKNVRPLEYKSPSFSHSPSLQLK